MTQDKNAGGKDAGKEEAQKPGDPKLEADLTDEELKAVVGGATRTNYNVTGVLYRK